MRHMKYPSFQFRDFLARKCEIPAPYPAPEMGSEIWVEAGGYVLRGALSCWDGDCIFINKDKYYTLLEDTGRKMVNLALRRFAAVAEPDDSIHQLARIYLCGVINGVADWGAMNAIIEGYNVLNPPPPPPLPPPTPWKPRPKPDPPDDDPDGPIDGADVVQFYMITRTRGVGSWVDFASPDLRKPHRHAAYAPDQITVMEPVS